MKQKNMKTFFVTMFSAIMLTGIIITAPDPTPDESGSTPAQFSEESEDPGIENGITPLSDLREEKLD